MRDGGTAITPDPGAAILTRGISHAFRGRGALTPVLDDVGLVAPAGSFVSLVGPSGCGKSTLLRIIAGLLKPDAGAIAIGGVEALGRTGLVSFMPQRDLLLPWRRALANAVLGAEIAGLGRAAADKRARALFPTFGLAGFERAWPSQLSGGMRQRLALLRTFLHPARALLLDEPLGALDAITRRRMHRWLQDVWEADRRTVLLVTHDVEEALILSDIVYVMSERPGSITARVEVAFGRPREPGLVSVSEFVGLKSLLLEHLSLGPDPG